jgi:uncharacterized Tic20 family protein
MKHIPSTEERVWAVLSHLSAIAFGMGIVMPVIGWSDQRRKSKYASFQCLQALGYQSLGYTIWILSYLLITILLLLVFVFAVGVAGENSGRMDAVMGVWMTVFFVFAFGFLGIYLLFPAVAAIACALGKDFRYPIMGTRLARYLGYEAAVESEWLIEEHEDRWVAAMGHFSVIIMLWGMLAPLTVWVLQGKRSLFLRFQSMQTLVYQAGVTLLYLGAMFIYFSGFFLLFAVLGLMGEAQLSSASAMLGLALFIVFSAFAFFIILLVPLFHILGQWAGYRTLKGDDYRYPIVGKLIDKWIANQPPQPAA